MALYKDFNNVKPEIKRDTADEYKRTNTNLVVDHGDVPSGKKKIDPRLPKLFKFGYGGQSGYIVLPKGRVVSLVPDREFKDFDDNKFYNAVTLANGGVDVVEANDDPQGDGGNYTRVANKPVGVSNQNVYQDLDDEFAGNQPGFMTSYTINLPYFNTKEEAEKMEWGSAYGGDIKPGDRVMSDENGRIVKYTEGKVVKETITVSGTDIELGMAMHPDVKAEDVVVTDNNADVELTVASVDQKAGVVTLDSTADTEVEVQYRSVLANHEQLVGMVTKVDRNLIPAGWLKWVMPEGAEGTEDPTGFEPQDLDDAEGYPYINEGDAKLKIGDERPTGIPGLTDGMNYVKTYEGDEAVKAGEITDAFVEEDTVNFRIDEKYLPIEEVLTLEIGNDTDGFTDIADSGYAGDAEFKLDKEAGLLRITLGADELPSSGDVYEAVLEFSATHQMAGMPTHIDWDGVIGSVDVKIQL